MYMYIYINNSIIIDINFNTNIPTISSIIAIILIM